MAMCKINFKFLLIILLIAYGCTDNADIKPLTPVEDPVIKRILSAGFKREDIVEYKDHYVVEGDIIFYKKEPAPAKGSVNGRTQQARADFLVSPSHYNINVFLNTASFSSINLEDALNTTVSAINDLGSGIQLSRVYSAAEADIEIIQ